MIIQSFSRFALIFIKFIFTYSQHGYIQIHLLSHFSHDYVVIVILSSINVIDLLRYITSRLCNADHYSDFFLVLIEIICRRDKMTYPFLLTWEISADRETIVDVIYIYIIQ